MKNAIGALLLVTACGFSAQAATPKYWLNEAEKIVVIAVNPVLKLQLTKLAVDEQTYAQFDVSLNYESTNMKSQIDSVMRTYPGYLSQRVVTSRVGEYRMQIPALGIDRLVDPKPGVEGPYVEDMHFVSRKDYQALKSAMARGESVVRFEGQIQGTVPTMKVLERREVDDRVCYSIVKSFPTVGELISGTTMVSPRALGIQEFQYDSTRVALVNDIRDNCFDTVTPTSVSSFVDLLKVGIRAKPVGRKLFGETRQKVYDREVFPLAYETQQTGGAE